MSDKEIVERAMPCYGCDIKHDRDCPAGYSAYALKVAAAVRSEATREAVATGRTERLTIARDYFAARAHDDGSGVLRAVADAIQRMLPRETEPAHGVYRVGCCPDCDGSGQCSTCKGDGRRDREPGEPEDHMAVTTLPPVEARR